jgi:hypothetical protein
LPRTKKDCETIESDVFAIPGLPLAHFSTAESGFYLKGRASRTLFRTSFELSCR